MHLRTTDKGLSEKLTQHFVRRYAKKFLTCNFNSNLNLVKVTQCLLHVVSVNRIFKPCFMVTFM